MTLFDDFWAAKESTLYVDSILEMINDKISEKSRITTME